MSTHAPMTIERHRHAKGFSLLEVLIAVLVLAVGLLGLAALQTQALRFNNSAYVRSQAVQFSYDMADRIRANVPGLEALDTNDVIDYTVDSAYEFGNHDCPDGALPPDPACIASGCTPAQIAQFDFRTWNEAIEATLPRGCGIVTHPAANLVEITVSWTEQVDLDGDGVPDQQSFVLRFEP